MQGLATHVQQDNAQHQRQQRLGHIRQRPPRQQQYQQSCQRGALAPATVGPVPCACGCQGPYHADQAKRADGGVRIRPRRCRQRQHQRAPENIECGKHAQCQHAAHLQHPVAAQQLPHRRQQLLIAERGQGMRAGHWQLPPEQHCQHQHTRSRHHINAAPASHIAHSARKHPGQQQPSKHTALHDSHHPATLCRGCNGCGICDQPLGHGGAHQPDSQHPGHQACGRRRQGYAAQRQHQTCHLRQHQAASLDLIAQRYQQHQRQQATQLGGAHHPADCRMANVKCGGQSIQ